MASTQVNTACHSTYTMLPSIELWANNQTATQRMPADEVVVYSLNPILRFCENEIHNSHVQA